MVGRIESNSSWVPPGIRRWSYQSIWRHDGRVALDVYRQRGALDHDLPFGDAGFEGGEVGAGGHGAAVLDVEPAVREVDDETGIGPGGKRVAVHRRLGADGELRTDAVVERGGVVAGFGRLVA